VDLFASFFGVSSAAQHRRGGQNMNTLALPKTLLNRLERFTAHTKATPAAVLKQALTNQLDHDEWLLEQVEKGLEDVAAGRVHSAESVKKMLGLKNATKR
jgi:predicted transcriptional regulator